MIDDGCKGCSLCSFNFTILLSLTVNITHLRFSLGYNTFCVVLIFLPVYCIHNFSYKLCPLWGFPLANYGFDTLIKFSIYNVLFLFQVTV